MDKFKLFVLSSTLKPLVENYHFKTIYPQNYKTKYTTESKIYSHFNRPSKNVSFNLYLDQRLFGGGPIFLEFYVPLPPPLYCSFINKFLKFGVLCPAILFKKFPKISQKFPEIF